MAASEVIDVENAWALAHASVADNTVVILTPTGTDVEWAISDTAVVAPPSNDIPGHNLSVPIEQNSSHHMDRQFILKNGERLYLRGPDVLRCTMTVKA